MPQRVLALSLVVLGTVVLSPALSEARLAAETSEGRSVWDSRTTDSEVSVSLRGAKSDSEAKASRPLASSQQADAPAFRYERRPVCVEWDEYGGSGSYGGEVQREGGAQCREEVEPEEGLCPAGVEPLLPMWRSPLIDADGLIYGPWVQVTGFECPRDALTEAVEQAWRQMVITPQAISILPDQGWAIASMGVKADLDDSSQTSSVTIMGRSVILRATPADQQWTVTDVLTGDSWPGEFETGPHGEEVITFERKQQRVRLGLSTIWEGHFSLDNGSTWLSAPGTATTTTDPMSVHVYNPRARLVNCDTFGDCMGRGASSNPFTLTDPDADGIDNYTIPDDQIGDYLAKRAKSRN